MSNKLDSRNVMLLSLLRKARVSKGMTQLDLAERLGKPQSWISKIEKSELDLNVMDLFDICAALDINPSEIVALTMKGIDE